MRFSLRIGTTGSPVPHRSLVRVLAAFMPGASGALHRSRPRLIPGPSLPLVSTPLGSSRHVFGRFTFVRLHGPHLTRSTPRLFHRRSPPGLLTPAARGGLMPAPARRHRGALPHLRQSIERCRTLLSHPTLVQDTQRRLTLRSSEPPLSSNVRPTKIPVQFPASTIGFARDQSQCVAILQPPCAG